MQLGKKRIYPSSLLPLDKEQGLMGGQKEYFFVYNKREQKRYILSPELTYSSFVTLLQNKEYYDGISAFYSGKCFRNENEQRNRYKQFNQLGAEFIANNQNKIFIYTIVHIMFLNSIFKVFIDKGALYKCVISCAQYTKDILLNVFMNHELELEFIDNATRHGNEDTPYIGTTYEFQFLDSDSNVFVEVVGGGEYSVEYGGVKRFGTGFAIGEKRFENIVLNKINDKDFLEHQCFEVLKKRVNDKILSVNFYQSEELYVTQLKKLHDIISSGIHFNFNFTKKKNVAFREDGMNLDQF